MQRAAEFLVLDLKSSTSLAEAEKRIFFVSAREALEEAPGSDQMSAPLKKQRGQEWQRYVGGKTLNKS